MKEFFGFSFANLKQHLESMHIQAYISTVNSFAIDNNYLGSFIF